MNLSKQGKEMKDYNEKDVKFVRDMISHHEAALKMASDIQAMGSNKEISTLATNILSAQNEEIKQMKEWLKKRDLTGKTSSVARMRM